MLLLRLLFYLPIVISLSEQHILPPGDSDGFPNRPPILQILPPIPNDRITGNLIKPPEYLNPRMGPLVSHPNFAPPSRHHDKPPKKPKHHHYLSSAFQSGTEGTSSTSGTSKSNHHKHPYPYLDNSLSSYIINEILEQNHTNCYANLLSNGNLGFPFSYSQKGGPSLKNITLNTPTLLIRCNDSIFDQKTNQTISISSENSSSSASVFLKTVALHLGSSLSENPSPPQIYDDSRYFLPKARFYQSLIAILLLQTTTCIGSWMIFLVIILLPSDNHNRTIPVTIFVTLYSIIQTTFLTKAIREVFTPQYELNIQDPFMYELQILELNGYKVAELIINIVSNINWVYIIYYMYHKKDSNQKKIEKYYNNSNQSENKYKNMQEKTNTKHKKLKVIWIKWAPSFMNNRNRFIITTGTIFFLLDSVTFGIVIWERNLFGLRTFYKVVEGTIYTLYLCLVLGFIWLNFGNVLIRQRVRKQVPLTLRNKIRVLWKDHYDMLPILIYNVVAIIAAYVCIVCFTTRDLPRSRWRYNLIYLLKMLITVNTWGLIGFFEKKEITLNKKTIIGRKISNKDPYFIDISDEFNSTNFSSSPRSSFDSFKSSATSHVMMRRSVSHGDSQRKKVTKSYLLPYPLTSWRSKIKRAKDNRLRAKIKMKRAFTRKPFKLTNTLNALYSNGSSSNPNSNISSSDSISDSFTIPNQSSWAVKNCNPENNFSTSYDNTSDTQTFETELTRNLIYYHNQRDSE